MRVVVICLIIILFGLQYKLWLGDDSLLHWMQLDRKLKAQTEENAKLLI